MSKSPARTGFTSGLIVGAAATLAAIALYFEISGDRLDQPSVQDDAASYIQENYFHEVSDAELETGSIRGIIEELRKDYDDKFSHYFDPEENEEFEHALSPEFSGVGLTIKDNPKGLEVTAVIPDSPAEAANLQVGDVVTEADGESLAGVATEVATARIKGKPGTEVDLQVDPVTGGKPRDITLERAKVNLPAATGRIEHANDEKVAYVAYQSFDEGAHGELRSEIDRLYTDGAKGLILDLRGNGGGRLDEGVLSASIFVDEGTIVTTRGRAVGEKVYDATGGAIDPKPMVVLIDGGTASASEILTAAIKDYDLATVVGERSYGKGTVQQRVPLPDGSAINLTVAQYFTADGTSIAGEGIHPDVRAVDDPKTEDVDEGLEGALDVLGRQLP